MDILSKFYHYERNDCKLHAPDRTETSQVQFEGISPALFTEWMKYLHFTNFAFVASLTRFPGVRHGDLILNVLEPRDDYAQ